MRPTVQGTMPRFSIKLDDQGAMDAIDGVNSALTIAGTGWKFKAVSLTDERATYELQRSFPVDSPPLPDYIPE